MTEEYMALNKPVRYDGTSLFSFDLPRNRLQTVRHATGDDLIHAIRQSSGPLSINVRSLLLLRYVGFIDGPHYSEKILNSKTDIIADDVPKLTYLWTIRASSLVDLCWKWPCENQYFPSVSSGNCCLWNRPWGHPKWDGMKGPLCWVYCKIIQKSLYRGWAWTTTPQSEWYWYPFFYCR